MTEYLIVLNKDEDTLSIVDIKTQKVIKTLETDHNPHEIVITPDGKKSYITCSLGNVINVLDHDSFEITNKIHHEKFDFPHGLGISKDGILYLASTYSNEIFAIDTKTDSILNHFNTGQNLSHMIALDPEERKIYVPNIGSHNITVINKETLEIENHFNVGKGPEGLAVNPEGDFLYVANQEDDTLYIIDTKTLKTLYKRRVGACPIRMVFSPDGKYALIPNRESGDLSVILTKQVINGITRPWEIKRIPIGKWPGGTVFNHNGSFAYVANNKTNDISVIDMTSLKEISRIDVGIHPDGMAYLKI